ncbi:MAG: sodium:solute symporter family transporter, partial [Peptostreptococcaceae bacterium]
MTLQHYLGAIIVLVLITGVGIYSGRRVSSAGDFASGGRKAGISIIAGSIIGTLVGGASTIGTAQLAFNYGFSAWWFTLGGGIGCLFLGLVFAKPLYNSEITTLPQVFSREYGRNASTTATILMSLGSFLS